MGEKLNWYVIYVMGGKENTIVEYLKKDENLDAFCPQVEVIHRKQGRSYIVNKPMFPSYIFIKTSLKMSEFQDIFKQKRYEKSGMIKDLQYGDDIPALHDSEIVWIERLLDNEAIVRKSTGMIEGDRVIIENGPLKGYESYIIHIDRHKRKATLAFEMLGKEVRLDTALEIIKKI